MHDPKIPAAVVQALLGFAQQIGLDRDETIAAIGLEPAQLASEEALVPFEAPIRVWEVMLAHRSGEPLGLMLADTMRPDVFGLAGHLFRHSETVEQVLERMRRYQQLVDPLLRLEVAVDNGKFRLEFHHDPRVLRLKHPIECMVGSGLHTLREWLSSEVACEVWFAHAPHCDVEIYEHYLRAPCHFEMPANAILAPAEVLGEPIPHADPLVAGFLRRLADKRLEEQRDVSLAARVAQVIEARLGNPLLSQDDVATELGISVRTMQRHLRQEGQSYSTIHDQVRRTTAERLLREGKLAIYQIAETTGYAEPANFTRAFRRWTGQSPAEFAAGSETPDASSS